MSESARAFVLAHLVPPALRDVLLNIQWDCERLFALDLRVEEVAVADLAWQLELPWWRDGGRHFAVTPNQVRADPVRYSAQWKRTLAADLSFPISLVENRGRWVILDGVHRLLRASHCGHPGLPAQKLDGEHVRQIATPG